MIILDHEPYQLSDTAICIGKFDGLHQGHQVLLDAIKKSSCKTKVLFTFDFDSLEQIYDANEKQYIAEELGIDVFISREFDHSLRHMSPKDFLEKILVEQCGAKLICVGDDFRFGYERKGDIHFLKQYQDTYNYDLMVFKKKSEDGSCISSTRIRKELRQGTIQKVNEWLGRPYIICGNVVHGNQLGHTLGMPTANLIPAQHKVLPRFGVYASKTKVNGQWYTSVTNLGIKPTIPGETVVGAETYIFDFNEDIYGKEICVELHGFIRGEKKFSDLEQLKQQMEKDKENVRKFFL